MENKQLKFCGYCAAPLKVALPEQDTVPRLMCTECGSIHYQNPKILVSCIATWQGKALWMQRAQQPQRGTWSIPSGFMEQGETLRQAAARELYEETHAVISPEDLSLYVTGTISTKISEVYVVFRGELQQPDFSPGHEALDTQLFDNDEVPWQDYAFPEVIEPMKQFYQDMQRGQFGLYMGEITESGHDFWSITD